MGPGPGGKTWTGLNGRAWRADLGRYGLYSVLLVLEGAFLTTFTRAGGCLIWLYQGLCLSWIVLAEIDARRDISPQIDIYVYQWQGLEDCLSSGWMPRVAVLSLVYACFSSSPKIGVSFSSRSMFSG